MEIKELFRLGLQLMDQAEKAEKLNRAFAEPCSIGMA